MLPHSVLVACQHQLVAAQIGYAMHCLMARLLQMHQMVMALAAPADWMRWLRQIGWVVLAYHLQEIPPLAHQYTLFASY
jgi:hypothetical protein